MKNMKPNGMVGYSNFIKGLSEDEYITKAILAESRGRCGENEEGGRERRRRPDRSFGRVTANELRSAQSLIKDKLLDKHSSPHRSLPQWTRMAAATSAAASWRCASEASI